MDVMNETRIRYYLGLDIGGTKCATLLAKVSGNDTSDNITFLERDEFETYKYDCKNLLSLFVSKFSLYISNYNIIPDALGISCGGPLDSINGIIQSPPNLPGWNDVPIVKLFQSHFTFPIYLENDANAGVLAESLYGAGKGKDNLIFLTFGTGLGAGLILNRHLFKGSSNMAGEVGHIRLAEEGPVGYHKKGSFEGFCSGMGIAQLGYLMIQKSKEISTLRNYPVLTAKIIGDEADKGDLLAISIYQKVGYYLGKGLAVLIDSFNPDMIIIGGIFSKSHHLIEHEMNKVLAEEALPQSLRACTIVPSRLGERIGDYSAISIAIKGGRYE